MLTLQSRGGRETEAGFFCLLLSRGFCQVSKKISRITYVFFASAFYKPAASVVCPDEGSVYKGAVRLCCWLKWRRVLDPKKWSSTHGPPPHVNNTGEPGHASQQQKTATSYSFHPRTGCAWRRGEGGEGYYCLITFTTGATLLLETYNVTHWRRPCFSSSRSTAVQSYEYSLNKNRPRLRYPPPLSCLLNSLSST